MINEKRLTRRVMIAVGILIISLPIAFVYANTMQIIHYQLWIGKLFYVIAFSMLICRLITWSRKIFYWCLHGFIWLLGLALWFDKGFVNTWFLFPLGFSVILAACYSLIVKKEQVSLLKDEQPLYEPPQHMH